MSKPSRRRPALRIESLEDRRVPATWGIPWADPQHLTASFVPDGTSLPGGTSNLYQLLNGQLGSGDWEVPILKALQTWAVNSNINIGVVSDGGEPVGVAGLAQSDARFGDIRISAEPLSSDVLAITTPYSPANGTLSGDIIINSNDDFNPSDAGSVDLYTVILHEAGHVFSFADSSDPSSFMYNVYQGPRAGISSAAVTAIQNLYGGARNIDALDGNAVSTVESSPVNFTNVSSTRPTFSLPGDIATAQTTNYFAFKAPTSITDDPLGLDVTVQTAGLSSLTPELTVYAMGTGGSLGAVVGTATASGPLAGGTTIHIGLPIAGQKYVIAVQGATGDVFSVGSYEMTLSATLASSASVNATKGSSPISEPIAYNGLTPLTVSNTITSTNQVDVYSFKTPASLSSILTSLTVSLQDWGFGLSVPSVGVYNSLGVLVGSATASSMVTPSTSVQLTSILPGTTYYVRVTDGTINPMDFGTYQVSVSFGSSSVAQPSTFVLAVPWYGSTGTAPVTNTSLSSAAPLTTPVGEATNSRYEAIDGVDPAVLARYYALTAPSGASGQPLVMTVSVQTLGTDALAPTITIFGSNGVALNAQSLTSQNGIAVVQVTLPTPGAKYFIEVAASAQSGASLQGNYVLDTTFGSTMATIGPIASGTLAATTLNSAVPVVSTNLWIPQGELVWLDLSGTSTNPPTSTLLQLTVLDSTGKVVTNLTTPDTLSVSTDIYLSPGIYTVEVTESNPLGIATTALSFVLNGSNNTDPLKCTTGTGSGGGVK